MEIRNNVQSPNFMAFIINKNNPKLPQVLDKLSNEELLSMKKAGEILGREGDDDATKYYHVEVDLDEYGEPAVRLNAEQDAYFGPFQERIDNTEYRGSVVSSTSNDEILIYKNSSREPFAWVSKLNRSYDLPPIFSVMLNYTNVTPAETEYLAEVAKVLDTVAAQKTYQNSQRVENSTNSEIVDELMRTYSK